MTFPNFPYTLNSEPDENWTVEHVLQWHLLKSHAVTDVKHEELVASLTKQLEVGTKELQQLQAAANVENNNPVTKTTTMTTTTMNKNKTTRLTTIQLILTTGPHEDANKTIELHPKSNAPCMVGRSAGKKFRDKGLSLSKDSEVSTTHGKFEILRGKAYFTDVGSTNGTTHHDGVVLEPNEAFELEENMILVVGGTTIQIVGLV